MLRKMPWTGWKYAIAAVMAVLITMLAAGCEREDGDKNKGYHDPEDNNVPAGLLGAWNGFSDGTTITFYSDGTFWVRENGKQIAKGTFTISGNNITITTTHISGAAEILRGNSKFDPSKWYDKNSIASTDSKISANDIDEIFKPGSGTYNGVSLSLPNKSTGGQTTLTKPSENTPGTTPGTNPGTTPGTNPGTTPGTNPGTTPGTNPGTVTPAELNGMWNGAMFDGREYPVRLVDIILNNGSFEAYVDGFIFSKGSFSVSGNRVITQTPSHISGAFFARDKMPGVNASSWYTKDEFRRVTADAGVYVDQEWLDEYFKPKSGTYSDGKISFLFFDENTTFEKFPGNAQQASLNGTWVGIEGGNIPDGKNTMILNNGSFDMSGPAVYNNCKVAKGTYSTSGNNFTMKVTHVHGDIYNAEFEASRLSMRIESKWYTKDELKAALLDVLVPYYEQVGLVGWMLEEQLNRMDESIEDMFKVKQTTFVLNGNHLYLPKDNGYMDSYTRSTNSLSKKTTAKTPRTVSSPISIPIPIPKSNGSPLFNLNLNLNIDMSNLKTSQSSAER